jgi:prepilin-type N-terminal cleavage/methylation domain-containing protein
LIDSGALRCVNPLLQLTGCPHTPISDVARETHLAMREIMKTQRGFSLVELMVALVAGLIVSGAVVAFTMSSMKSNSEYVLSTRLTQELRNTLDLATRDLRRAGYDDDALKYVGNDNASPFSPLHLETTTESDGSKSSCVIYAYDRTYPNGSTVASPATPPNAGALNLDNGEVRGIRRRQVTSNGRTVGVIEYAESAGTVKPECSNASASYSTNPPTCVATWCPLSDSRKLDITGFEIVNNFQDIGTSGNEMRMRTLDIKIIGRLAGSTEFTRDVLTRVKVSADCARSDFSACSNASP